MSSFFFLVIILPSGHQIHLGEFDQLRLLEEFPTDVENGEQYNSDVGCDKCRQIKRGEEAGIARHEDQKGIEDNDEVCAVGE